MKRTYKYLQFLTLGVFLLSSSAIFAASKECFSPNELNDFKTLYIKLQQQLNYEAKDAYLDKKFQVQLKPHSKNAVYPGKEFESALFGEYQNSLRKIGKLYQSAKYENDDSFKSNELLVNFMKAIDDKSSESADFISKTKIKDVIDALEEASRKKYANSNDKKFMINAGDKYLLEKLLIHAQDRVCSVNKFDATNKGTPLFKADYLKQIKNAPLNILVNTIKNAPIEKNSKIDLRETSDLTASLVDPNVAVESAVADNLNQLSAWVKKIKANGPKCLAAIKSKNFANQIQANIQGCNFGRFIETLSQNNVDNLESVLHFINANEKLLNNPAAKAETGLDELKLEGFISTAFDNLGTAVRCTQLDAANSGDKKVFIRNLPFNEKSNKFDTSGIICKSSSKLLGPDICKKQYDLVSDGLGRGVEIKPKKGATSDLTFSVKDTDNCSDISLQNPANSSLASTEEACVAQLKDGSAFNWDKKANKCNEVEIAKVASIEQCMALKKEGSVFNWDSQKKSCGEFSALLTDAVLTQSTQQCMVQKKDGYSFKWDSAKKSCEETPTLAGTKLESKIACDAKASANLPFKWNATENVCEKSPVLTATELKAKEACEARPKQGLAAHWDNQNSKCNEIEISKIATLEQCEALKKPGSVFNWNAQKNSCNELPALLSNTAASVHPETKQTGTKLNEVDLAKATTIEQCVALKKTGSVFNWDAQKSACNEFSALLSSAALKQSAQQCEVQKKDGSSFKWDSSKNECKESSALLDSSHSGTKQANNQQNDKNTLADQVDLSKVTTVEQCVALKKKGSAFNWNSQKSSCDEFSSMLPAATQKQAAQQCLIQKKNGYDFKWDSANNVCHEIPTIAGTKLESKISCDSKTSAGLPYKWNSKESFCEKSGTSYNLDSRSPALSSEESKNTDSSNVISKDSASINAGSKGSPSTNANSKDSASMNAGSKDSTSTNAISKDNGTANAISKGHDSNNTTSKSTNSKENTPSLSNAISEKQAQTACESKSSSTHSYKWNSSSKNCEGQVSASSSGNKAPIVKPIVLTNEESKSPAKIPSVTTTGPKTPINTSEELKTKPSTLEEVKIKPVTPPASGDNGGTPLSTLPNNSNNSKAKFNCEDQQKAGSIFRWLPDTQNCVEEKVEASKAQLNCEANKQEGFEYKWMPDSSKCVAIDLNAKTTCEEKKKDGVTFSWDAVKEVCNEVPATEVKKEEVAADKALEDGEKKCEADNAKWIEDSNDGRPGIKWEWDGKVCQDKKPSKDSGKKKEAEAEVVEEEAPANPKRAPARFTPINIPSRQIYLMPGMP